MSTVDRVSNERKNLNRLTGEFLVASRIAQRGFMVSLQWGNAISYDILAFDKHGNVAFIEVKCTAAYPRWWVLQSKYAHPREDAIPSERRFVCCVDISSKEQEPCIHVFPESSWLRDRIITSTVNSRIAPVIICLLTSNRRGNPRKTYRQLANSLMRRPTSKSSLALVSMQCWIDRRETGRRYIEAKLPSIQSLRHPDTFAARYFCIPSIFLGSRQKARLSLTVTSGTFPVPTLDLRQSAQ